MVQVPLPSVTCVRFGSVFLFPQLLCFNTTVHTHIGVFIRDIQSGEFDSSKNWVFPKTPLPWSITEGHGCWVHSCWSHWREQTLFTAFVCVVGCTVHRVYWFFRTRVPGNTTHLSELSTQQGWKKAVPWITDLAALLQGFGGWPQMGECSFLCVLSQT